MQCASLEEPVESGPGRLSSSDVASLLQQKRMLCVLLCLLVVFLGLCITIHNTPKPDYTRPTPCASAASGRRSELNFLSTSEAQALHITADKGLLRFRVQGVSVDGVLGFLGSGL